MLTGLPKKRRPGQSLAEPRAFFPASAAWARSPRLYALSARRCPVFAWMCRVVESVESHRLYVCAHCNAQVHICRRCDRGQIYCASGCAAVRRHDSRLRAGARYQASQRGAHQHAARQRRWRARERDAQQNVTHQGSLGQGDARTVVAHHSRPLGALTHAQATPRYRASRTCQDVWAPRCTFCGRALSPFMRLQALRRRV